MKFSLVATSLLLSTAVTAIPTTEAAVYARETSLVDSKVHSRAAEPVAEVVHYDDLLLKRADPPKKPAPIDPVLAEQLTHATKEHQKPGIGQGPTLGIDPGAGSGLVITSLVIFFFGSLIWFTTEDDQW